MTPRRGRLAGVLIGAVKLAALIAVAGGAGVALGYGLSNLSDDNRAASPAGAAETVAATTARSTRPATRATATAATATSAAAPPPPPPPPATTTTRTTASAPRAGIDIRVLGAILRPAGTASGIRRNRARITMRIRAENRGSDTVSPALPRLQIDDSSVGPDSNALTPATQIGELAPGATKAITLRFELTGSTTARVIRDRRAQLTFAGRSKSVRIVIGDPLEGPEG